MRTDPVPRSDVSFPNIHVGCSFFDPRFTFWSILAYAIRDRAGQMGIQCSEMWALTVPEQINVIKKFVAQQVNALIIGPVEGTHRDLRTAIRETVAAGIPVIVVDQQVPDCQAACTVQADNFKGGELAALSLLECLCSHGAIALIDAPCPHARVRGFVDTLALHPDRGTLVFREPGDWSRESGARLMRLALKNHPDLRGVFAVNDSMAIGALDEIAAAGRAGHICLVGYDGLADSFKAIRDRSMAATISQSPQTIGRIAVEMLARVLQGESVPPVVLTDIALITHDNLLEMVLKTVDLFPGVIGGFVDTQEALQTVNAELEQRVAERTHELAAAYEEIRIMNTQLQNENLRMRAELDVSHRIQQMVLPSPKELEMIEGVEIVGYMQPADEVGGDYYDVLHDQEMLHIGIGDVTGHGLESGVLMLMTQAAIRTLIEHGETDPVKFVSTLNRLIYKNAERMGTDKNMTFSLVQYHQGQLKLAGQHEEMLVVRHGGQIERVDTMNLGFPVGLEPEISQWVNAITITLQPGDGIVLYTDGITEAENPENQQYGLDRLCAVISRHWAQSAEAIKQAIVEDVLGYIDAQKIYDDLTLVVLKTTASSEMAQLRQ